MLFGAVMAQPKEDKIEYNKLQVPDYSVEVPVAPSVAEEKQEGTCLPLLLLEHLAYYLPFKLTQKTMGLI